MAENEAVLEERLARLRLNFAENLGERIGAMEEAAEAIDAAANDRASKSAVKQLLALAHKLAGAGTTFGFPNVSRISKELERLCEALVAANSVPDTINRNRIDDMLRALRREADQPPQEPETTVDLEADEETAPWHVLLVEDDNAQARAVMKSLKSGP
ncbi:MAG: Hpt domain-containing protein, partial [Rhodospirillales bacterium]|nr:Hpt domain-containing protein [Rhodospirillales bacterium]